MNHLNLTKKRVAVHINELESMELIKKNKEGRYLTTLEGNNALKSSEIQQRFTELNAGSERASAIIKQSENEYNQTPQIDVNILTATLPADTEAPRDYLLKFARIEEPKITEQEFSKRLEDLKQRGWIEERQGKYSVTWKGSKILRERQIAQMTLLQAEQMGLYKGAIQVYKGGKRFRWPLERKTVEKAKGTKFEEYPLVLKQLSEEIKHRDTLWNEIWKNVDEPDKRSPEAKKLARIWQRDLENGNSGPSRFQCPECGELLSLVAYPYDESTGELGIQCTCEWCDYVGFEVNLGIMWQDLKFFKDKAGLFKAKLFNVTSP
jgi:predicted transcriptional regulator